MGDFTLMATNNFKAFALDPNANVMSQADWEALPALLSGFTAGKASSAQVNKALRQATTIAALVGQFIANSGADALDNADVNGLVSKFTNALTANLGLGTASKRNVGTGTNQIPDMSEFTLENNFASGSATGYLKVNIAGIRIIAGTVSIPFTNPSTAPVGTAVTGVFTLPSAFPTRLLSVIGCGGDMAALNSGYFSCATNGNGADGRSKFAWTYRAIGNNLSSGATFANFLAIGI